VPKGPLVIGFDMLEVMFSYRKLSVLCKFVVYSPSGVSRKNGARGKV